MTWTGGTGAPRNMPYDATPLRAARVDVKMRIAWLLRVTRMASPRGGTGKEFSARLKTVGVDVSDSTLSRCEQGRLEVSAELIGGYETLLGFPAGHLLGICELLRDALRPDLTLQVRALDPLELRREYARVTDVIHHGQPSGADWLTLTRLLEAPEPILPEFVQEEWWTRLVDEMSRSLTTAYSPRTAALTRLMANEDCADVLVRVVADRLNEPGAQSLADVIGLLGVGTHPDGVDLALQLLTSDRLNLRPFAGLALLERAVNGRMAMPDGQRLARTVLQLAYDDPQNSGDIALGLGRRLSPGVGAEVARAVGAHIPHQGEVATVDDPPELRRYLTVAQEVFDLDEDRMLERLLREALNDDFNDRAHLARMLLCFSPYAEALARVAIKVQVGSPSVAARDAAGSLLMYLAKHVGADHFVGRLDSPDGATRASALWGLAHGPGVPADLDLAPLVRDDATRYVVTYAAGMSGHPGLAALRADTSLGADVRQSAGWWLQRGAQFAESA